MTNDLAELYRSAGLTGLVEVVQEQVAQKCEKYDRLRKEHFKISDIIGRAGTPSTIKLHRRLKLCAAGRLAFQPRESSDTARIPKTISIPLFCQSKHCPFCAQIDILQQSKRFYESFGRSQNKPLKFITLTVRNIQQGCLRSALVNLAAAWNRLRKDHLERNHQCVGFIVKREVTLNKSDNTWHPHIHAVADMPFLWKDTLSSLWCQVTAHYGLQASANATRIDALHDDDGQGAYELAKYCTKPIATTNTVKHIHMWAELVESWRGVRAFASGGTLKLAPVDRSAKGMMLLGKMQDVLQTAPQSIIDELTQTLSPDLYDRPSLEFLSREITHIAVARVLSDFRKQ